VLLPVKTVGVMGDGRTSNTSWRNADLNEVKGVNGWCMSDSKSPGTSEGEYRMVSIAEARANPLLSSIVRDLRSVGRSPLFERGLHDYCPS
jgi:hypothetical protein